MMNHEVNIFGISAAIVIPKRVSIFCELFLRSLSVFHDIFLRRPTEIDQRKWQDKEGEKNVGESNDPVLEGQKTQAVTDKGGQLV